MLVKHKCPRGNKCQIGYFQYKGHSQGHKVIDPDVIWKAFISWVYGQS